MSLRGWFIALCLLAALGLAAFAWQRAEGSAPLVSAPEAVTLGQAGGPVVLELADAGSGLREVAVELVHARGQAELLRSLFPGSWLRGGSERGPVRVEVAVDPRALELAHGDAVLRVRARDWSWRGNEAVLELPVRIDLEPPRIALASGLTYVRRGGSGAVRYSISESVARDGVEVGGEGEAARFYPGFPAPGGSGGERLAIFAVPSEAPAGTAIGVVAEDAAGNRTRARWPVVVQGRDGRDSLVTLPASFLEEKVVPLARAEQIPTADPVEAFRLVNTELRARNEARIRELLSRSEPAPLWSGAFDQLPNSQVTSRFAEHRLYFVGSQRVSEAVHYGYDLAATQATAVPAANAGRVVFAGDLGIYGQCVLIDHGVGLASLYGHLSRLDVAAGDRVARGQRLGLSGATGLAGGDHLHFAMLVGDTYVDPVEWWDPRWVQTHIEAHLPTPSP